MAWNSTPALPLQKRRMVPPIPNSVYVIMPAFNEGRVIQNTLRTLLPYGYRVVVVDDGSSDQTPSVLKTVPVYTLRHPINLGSGAALQTGMCFALRQGAEYLVHFDADGQHRAEDIARLLEPLRRGDADVALGSRFLRPSDRDAVPRSKQLLLRGAVHVDWLLTGIRLTDSHNGFRALTRHAASAIHLRENRFAYATEIISQIHAAGLRWVEVPTTVVYSDYSRAKGQPMSNALNIVIDVLLRKVLP